jgi:hypothetical protein
VVLHKLLVGNSAFADFGGDWLNNRMEREAK